jgi:hypothetical protein
MINITLGESEKYEGIRTASVYKAKELLVDEEFLEFIRTLNIPLHHPVAITLVHAEYSEYYLDCGLGSHYRSLVCLGDYNLINGAITSTVGFLRLYFAVDESFLTYDYLRDVL